VTRKATSPRTKCRKIRTVHMILTTVAMALAAVTVVVLRPVAAGAAAGAFLRVVVGELEAKIEVKTAYHLSTTQAEHNKLAEVLISC
jgi:hypothetical protein